MPQYFVQLQHPSEPVPTAMGGFAATFPFVVVPQEAAGTPLQSASSIAGRITAKITGSLLATWKLPVETVLKIMAYVLRRHVAQQISANGSIPTDATVELSTYTFPGQCPFDIGLLEELPGSAEPVAVNRPIGFV